jgi:hypothetical protein
VQLIDTTGLDLGLGYAVWCHYDPDDDRLIDDYVHETGIAVLAIPEQGGLARTETRFEWLVRGERAFSIATRPRRSNPTT